MGVFGGIDDSCARADGFAIGGNRDVLSAENDGRGSVVQNRVSPRLDSLVRIGWPDHMQARDGSQRGELLDWLVGGAVFSDTDGVVSEHKAHLGTCKSSQTDWRPHVVGEHEERRSNWKNTAMC